MKGLLMVGVALGIRICGGGMHCGMEGDGVMDNFHVKLDLYRKALRTYVFLYLGAQWSKKSKKPAEISSLTKITSDV